MRMLITRSMNAGECDGVITFPDEETRLKGLGFLLRRFSANRTWMKAFKARWKGRLEQLEIWMVSYRIDIE